MQRHKLKLLALISKKFQKIILWKKDLKIKNKMILKFLYHKNNSNNNSYLSNIKINSNCQGKNQT